MMGKSNRCSQNVLQTIVFPIDLMIADKPVICRIIVWMTITSIFGSIRNINNIASRPQTPDRWQTFVL